jgi:hypothetical protein
LADDGRGGPDCFLPPPPKSERRQRSCISDLPGNPAPTRPAAVPASPQLLTDGPSSDELKGLDHALRKSLADSLAVSVRAPPALKWPATSAPSTRVVARISPPPGVRPNTVWSRSSSARQIAPSRAGRSVEATGDASRVRARVEEVLAAYQEKQDAERRPLLGRHFSRPRRGCIGQKPTDPLSLSRPRHVPPAA